MVTQLRLYTINKGKMADFVKGWTEGVYPLHLEHGFTIDRAGVIEERNQFSGSCRTTAQKVGSPNKRLTTAHQNVLLWTRTQLSSLPGRIDGFWTRYPCRARVREISHLLKIVIGQRIRSG